MKRAMTVLILAIALVIPALAPAGGNTKTYTDPQDRPESALDISAAGFGHNRRLVVGAIATYAPFDLQIFKDGRTEFFADLKTKKGKFYLQIWYGSGDWIVKVFKRVPGRDDLIGRGAAVSNGDNGIVWGVKRRVIGAKAGSKVWWYATSSYRGGTGACATKACYDYLPNEGWFGHRV